MIQVKFIPKAGLKNICWIYRSIRLTQLIFPDSLRNFIWLNYVVKNILAGILLRRRGGLIHGSSVAIGSRAAVFVGKTGQGKSTVAKLLGKRILADDRSIIRFEKNIPYVYASPFYERQPFSKHPDRFPLKALFLLIRKKVDAVEIKLLPHSQAAFRLLPHIAVREETPPAQLFSQLKLALNLAGILTKTVKVYTLSYPLNFTGLEPIIYEAVHCRFNPPPQKSPHPSAGEKPCDYRYPKKRSQNP